MRKLTQKQAKKIVVDFTAKVVQDSGVGLDLKNQSDEEKLRIVSAYRIMGMRLLELHDIGQALYVPSERVVEINKRGW